MNLPDDPIILLSVINTKLRDFYPSLGKLCDEENIDESDLCAKLSSVGFEYDEKLNRFK